MNGEWYGGGAKRRGGCDWPIASEAVGLPVDVLGGMVLAVWFSAGTSLYKFCRGCIYNFECQILLEHPVSALIFALLFKETDCPIV